MTQSNYVPKIEIALNEGLSIFHLKFLSLIFRTFSKKEKPRQVAQGESGGVVVMLLYIPLIGVEQDESLRPKTRQ